MSSLTLFVLVAIAIWSYKPLRMFLIQRTNRTVKVLLVVFPLLFLGRVGYNLYSGQNDDFIASILLVGGLLLIWGALVWIGNVLEKRKPTKAQAPDLAVLSRLPGMPRPRGRERAACREACLGRQGPAPGSWWAYASPARCRSRPTRPKSRGDRRRARWMR